MQDLTGLLRGQHPGETAQRGSITDQPQTPDHGCRNANWAGLPPQRRCGGAREFSPGITVVAGIGNFMAGRSQRRIQQRRNRPHQVGNMDHRQPRIVAVQYRLNRPRSRPKDAQGFTIARPINRRRPQDAPVGPAANRAKPNA